MWRGRNRFFTLLKTFELLAERADVQASGAILPDTVALRDYVHSGVALGNPTLAAAVADTGNPELRRVLDWSVAVSDAIARRTEPIPPFEGALEALRRIASVADSMVVSQTPEAALLSEWRHHRIEGLVRLIAGQEIGTKAEQIRLAAGGKYPASRILLIGDAPGDLEAAQEAGVCFYPIVPGLEVECWARFNDDILERFLGGQYDKALEQALIAEFTKRLPSHPSWS